MDIMQEPILLFAGSVGLNTVVDPTRISFDPDTGISDLGVAVNITLDQTGYISRRPGYTQVESSNAHSLFCDKHDCLFISGDSLYRLLPNYSTELLRSGLNQGRRMAYTQVNADIYYTNEVDLGIIRESGVSEAWEASSYVGPTTNKVFDGPRPGRHLAFFAGRIFVFEEDVLWWSEPYAYSWFDRGRSFIQFPTNGRMIKPVEAGLFVSDSEKTYFLSGRDPQQFKVSVVSNYPVVEWSDAIDYVDALEAGLNDLGIPDTGLCALWASFEGACLGTSSGAFINLNKKKVIYPEYGNKGAGLLKGYNYIHNIGA